MKIAVISLRFAPGHIAHLRAFESLFTDLGHDVHLFLNQNYSNFIQPKDNRIFLKNCDEIIEWNPDLVLSQNISFKNIPLARKLKRNRIPFYYILHEPIVSLKEHLSMGKRLPRRIIADLVNYITCACSYRVLLASPNGEKKYRKYMRHCNDNYSVFPLIFCDDYDASCLAQRKFFSFIGGFTTGRANTIFLDFIKYSVRNKLGIQFCIATRNSFKEFLDDPEIKHAINEKILVVYSGKPMTTQEINLHYREAICVWNAYKFSTQSGVLPNALMQGTPVIITNHGDADSIVTHKKDSYFISLPHNNQQIREAYDYIKNHLDIMSGAAKETFNNHFFYRSQMELAKKVFIKDNTKND